MNVIISLSLRISAILNCIWRSIIIISIILVLLLFSIGIGLIQGKPSSAKDWTPAMVLARSSLELVTVRDYLYEDENGELFAKLKQEPGKSGPCWTLVSFFGEDTFELLNLYTEARDLMSNCGEYDFSGQMNLGSRRADLSQ